jgi:uncharacterized OB-fold protein
MSVEDHFNAALRAGRLEYQRCTACRHSWLPARAACPACLSPSSKWEQASGRATVVSWIVYHRAYAEHLSQAVPYNVAIVALEEGPRMITNILDGPPGAHLRVGQAVLAEIDTQADTPLCQFRPAPETAP